MLKAVIFDMDGVIYDSEPLHVKTEKQVLAQYGLKISSQQLAQYTGSTAKFMFEDLIQKYQLKTTFPKIFREKNVLFFKALQNNFHLCKGVEKLLMCLQKKNIKLALATSSHKKLAILVLQKGGLKKYFSVIVTAEDIVKPKPNPEIFLTAAQKLKVKPKDCLVVEDSTNGVLAAKKAKMRCIGYKNPHSGKQKLVQADMVIKDFTKLNVTQLIV